MNGYLNSAYALSLAEFGTPLALPGSEGWLLRRQIPDSDYQDATGCYPLFCCANWSALGADLAGLTVPLVSVAVVVDPFAPLTYADLTNWFHTVKPFKQHFTIDTRQPTAEHVTKHHKYYAQKALRDIRVEILPEPRLCLDEWSTLYDLLVRRHHLTGIKAFSKSAFAIQLSIPGLVAFRATHNGQTVGAHLWFVQSGVAYSHLAAYTREGYRLGAAYALYWEAIQVFKEQFAAQVRWIDLGSGAGAEGGAQDGLTRFKRGWATSVRTKYFCGRILDAAAYSFLIGQTGTAASSYFPAYRKGELA